MFYLNIFKYNKTPFLFYYMVDEIDLLNFKNHLSLQTKNLILQSIFLSPTSLWQVDSLYNWDLEYKGRRTFYFFSTLIFIPISPLFIFVCIRLKNKNQCNFYSCKSLEGKKYHWTHIYESQCFSQCILIY